MTVKALLVSAIALLITLLPQFMSIATAQERSNCYVPILGEERGSRVNMRIGPGADFDSVGYVLVGQVVNMLTPSSRDSRAADSRVRRQDNEGNTWFMVEYTPSRTRGWIRGDFIGPRCRLN